MAKDKEERIRELLNPREALIYQAEMHPAIYSLPLLVFLFGAVIVFLTVPEVLGSLPERWIAVGGSWINGAKETFLGFWMMGGGILFAFKFHLESKHLIQIVTNHRVVQVTGAFSTTQHEMPLHHITQIKIKRGHIINRLLHRGNIKLRNKKDDKERIVFQGVSHPDAFVEHIRLAQDRYGESLAIKERVDRERSKS